MHARLLGALAACLALAGCERAMRDMYDQPRLKTAATTPLFADGLASRPPPPGAEAYSSGETAANASGRRGAEIVRALDAADAAQAASAPDAAATLARGRERYAIYCAPCHGASGAGDGPVVQRGFPAPPSLALARLREAPDRHLFDVVTNGYGVMLPYADRVDAVDRWAIVAALRQLQAETTSAAPRATPTAATARTP
jgi:mono/diheme cytochrome c family protein